MSTPQVSKNINRIPSLAVKGTASPVSFGKLNGNSGASVKKASLEIVEEALFWQDKLMQAHLNLVVLPSGLLQKRALRVTRSKPSLYEKTKSLHNLNASILPNGFRTIYAGRAVQAPNGVPARIR